MLSKSLFRRPKNALENQDKASVPEKIMACPGCKKNIPIRAFEENHLVCPRCIHYVRMSARQRVLFLCDEGGFIEMDQAFESENLLNFPGYREKLDAAMGKTSEKEGVLTGTAVIGGVHCCFFAMEPGFMMGSMGTVVGEKITRLFEYALNNRLPVVGCTVSGGARMQEGILSLMQMAKVSGAVGRHSDAGLLYIALLTDPTSGGVTASFAMQADIILAEPGAFIGFAGPRVIEQTTRQKLPEGFQRAEFQLERGFLDLIVPRDTQRATLGRLLKLHVREDQHVGI